MSCHNFEDDPVVDVCGAPLSEFFTLFRASKNSLFQLKSTIPLIFNSSPVKDGISDTLNMTFSVSKDTTAASFPFGGSPVKPTDVISKEDSIAVESSHSLDDDDNYVDDMPSTENEAIIRATVQIQRFVRAWLNRIHQERKRSSFVVDLQAQSRAFLVRNRILALREKIAAAVAIQSAWRGYVTRRRWVKLI